MGIGLKAPLPDPVADLDGSGRPVFRIVVEGKGDFLQPQWELDWGMNLDTWGQEAVADIQAHGTNFNWLHCPEILVETPLDEIVSALSTCFKSWQSVYKKQCKDDATRKAEHKKAWIN